uniref:HTH myb-type domain-containing protein n=1 Tax=Aegilops tauschii TaxID=37682 RepID=M8BBM1_AEGTA
MELGRFDRDWRKIEAFVGSKTVIQFCSQIRSHAQKYFLKVQKNGTAPAAPEADLPQQPPHIVEQGCAIPMDAPTVATNSSANDTFPSWDDVLTQPYSPRHTQDLGAANNSSSSIECQSGTWATSDAIEQETWPTSDAIEQEIILPALHAMPDFAQVYNFLGGVFDPDTTGHLQKLREMDPIDAETVDSGVKFNYSLLHIAPYQGYLVVVILIYVTYMFTANADAYFVHSFNS